MNPIIRVENLSKQYKLGGVQTSYSTFRESLVNSLKAPLKARQTKEQRNFWALRDVNFEIAAGDVVGIVGRNGAGKSTLLKILSRITEPTTGRIELYGRVGSLLEVGTGFHPELTGRENIFLNGAILGMSKSEIARKFDEIVAFAEIERFIDTPVKFYSSGMYTRLAFAVAANLEPEILIVDEVLAVGDAEFQKKCLGKMSEAASHGRTVLFVSHNMVAVRNLCRRALFLQNGKLVFDSTAEEVVDKYLQIGVESASEREWAANEEAPGNEKITIRRLAVSGENKSPEEPVFTDENITFEVEFYNNLEDANIDVTWDLMDIQGTHVAHIGTICSPDAPMKKGYYRTVGTFPKNVLNSKRYFFSVTFGRNQRELLYRMDDALVFDVEDNLTRGNTFVQLPGVIHPKCDWQTQAL